MEIIDYDVENDKFEPESSGYFSFLCGQCKHRTSAADDDPCCKCWHNVNADDEEEEDV